MLAKYLTSKASTVTTAINYISAITDGSLFAHKFVLVLDLSAGIALALRCCQWERHRKACCISLGD